MDNHLLTALISIPQEAGYFFPDRHFQYIAGSPLYNVMIAKLEAIPQIGKIIINTDSDRIKNSYARSGKVKVVNAYQAEPQEAELELTSDRATAAILGHAEGEHFLQLGPIFPFLKHQTIESVIETYDKYVVHQEDHSNDSVFTIRVLNRRYYDSDADFIREDRPNTFVEDGILHVFNRTAFLAGGNRKVGKKPFAYSIDDIENLAIDSEENYRLGVFIDENRHRFPRVFGR
jgi:CMP-N-acetylneuraminic acid synthetase